MRRIRQGPKPEKSGRLLVFRHRRTDHDAEIAELTALRNAWSTGIKCLDVRIAELEGARREKGKRRA